MLASFLKMFAFGSRIGSILPPNIFSNIFMTLEISLRSLGIYTNVTFSKITWINWSAC